MEFGAGSRYRNVIFGGHSLGGIQSISRTVKNGGALIKLGAELICGNDTWGSNVRDFTQYPLPMMSILGELDGMVRWTFDGHGIVGMLNTAVQIGLK